MDEQEMEPETRSATKSVEDTTLLRKREECVLEVAFGSIISIIYKKN